MVKASSASYAQGSKPNRVSKNPMPDRYSIAREWQYEAYRHIHICGEARYAATLFAAVASRATLGIAEPNPIGRKTVWVTDGVEVDALNELASDSASRAKLIRDYMLHRVIAGECYLIARDRQESDGPGLPNMPIWEIVAVTEIRKTGTGDNAIWSVRHDNDQYIDLSPGDPVIRLWDPDPENRREAWSPFRSLLPTLREIEWLTMHIFTQVRSRLMSAGVWFLPENLTFPPPPVDAVEGGEEAIAAMNEAEQFMISLAASSMQMLDGDEVSFPSVVMADAAALANIDQGKLIEFWSDIDDAAMTLRAAAIQRFALGMDLPPEQVLGSSGAVSGSSGSNTGGQMNHWGQWALDEQTITAHIEPALNEFVGALLSSFLQIVVEGTDKVVAFDPTKLHIRPDRSKEATAWYNMGVLKAEVALRENGFDPENDMMDPAEHREWLLNRLASGSATPEQVAAALALLGVPLPNVPSPPDDPGLPSPSSSTPSPGTPGRNLPPAPVDTPIQGPPEGDHNHHDAPFSALVAASEVLVLRALEKAGNRLLNDGKRGRDKDRSTPAHLAHTLFDADRIPDVEDFDFTLVSTVFGEYPAMSQALVERSLRKFCRSLCEDREPYTRNALMKALR